MADFQDGKHMKSAKLRATVTQTRGSQGAQGYTSQEALQRRCLRTIARPVVVRPLWPSKIRASRRKAPCTQWVTRKCKGRTNSSPLERRHDHASQIGLASYLAADASPRLQGRSKPSADARAARSS